ncbi:hypothetical protein [Mycobacterium uberis]|nr:hypothetical protein [Mycobacterium uberis]
MTIVNEALEALLACDSTLPMQVPARLTLELCCKGVLAAANQISVQE